MSHTASQSNHARHDRAGRAAAAADSTQTPTDVTVHGLAHLRRRYRDHTQAQVAQAMRVSQARISDLERNHSDKIQLSTMRAYINALGGRVRVVADFDECTVALDIADEHDRP